MAQRTLKNKPVSVLAAYFKTDELVFQMVCSQVLSTVLWFCTFPADKLQNVTHSVD